MHAPAEHNEQRIEALTHFRQAREVLMSLSDHTIGGQAREEPSLTREEVLYRKIGQRIRNERKALGFNQIELADEVGLTRTSIVNIEAGRQRLPIHGLYAIAEALGVSVQCLLPEQE